jgi:hypothetical protein
VDGHLFLEDLWIMCVDKVGYSSWDVSSLLNWDNLQYSSVLSSKISPGTESISLSMIRWTLVDRISFFSCSPVAFLDDSLCSLH